MGLLEETLKGIKPITIDADGAIQRRLDSLTKPPGSLGRIEELAKWFASVTGRPSPRVLHKTVFTMAGDHGVAKQGVSAFPQEVTPQMVLNFLHGGAGINVLSKLANARVVVVDCGVAATFGGHTMLRNKKIALGTQDMSQGPAMTREQAIKSIEAGIESVEEELANGLDIIGTGDMGIANTTPATAILSVFTGKAPLGLTGRGTGLDDAGVKRKAAVIEKAIAINKPNASDALDVLAKVGGFEIGGIAGLCLAGARHRVPVLVDGFISSAGALLAAKLEPKVKPYIMSAHKSAEPGAAAMLAELGLDPVLDLGFRLGEGTGAAIAMMLVDAGVRILTEMATFEDAGVSTKCE